MKRFLVLLLAGFALLLMTGLAACGDDDDGDNGANGAATETPAGDGDATPVDSGDRGDRGDGDGTGAPIGDDGGESLSVEDYFAAMEEIGIRTNDELEAVQAELDNAVVTTDQEEIDLVRGAFQQTGESLELALLDVGDLEPPAEVEAEHAAFIETLANVLSLTSAYLQDTANVTTSTELDAISQDYNPDLLAADDEFDDACFDLQAIADDNGIAADIQCGDA